MLINGVSFECDGNGDYETDSEDLPDKTDVTNKVHKTQSSDRNKGKKISPQSVKKSKIPFAQWLEKVMPFYILFKKSFVIN